MKVAQQLKITKIKLPYPRTPSRNHGKQTPPEAGNRQEPPQLILTKRSRLRDNNPECLNSLWPRRKRFASCAIAIGRSKRRKWPTWPVPDQYARGGPTYSFEQKSDGRRYAVGGEVPIDISAEKTPEETLQKMQAGKRIASAPAEPSPADRSIAAATALKSQAHQEIATCAGKPSPRHGGSAGQTSDKCRRTTKIQRKNGRAHPSRPGLGHCCLSDTRLLSPTH